MKNEEIVRALRCISTAGGENACEHCPYWKEEEVPEEERPIYGADTMHSCDVDRVGLDGADLIERLTDRCALRRGDRRGAGENTVDSGDGAPAGSMRGCPGALSGQAYPDGDGQVR